MPLLTAIYEMYNMYDMGESLQLITCMTNEVVIFYRNILLHTSDKLNLHSMYLPTCMHCTLSLSTWCMSMHVSCIINRKPCPMSGHYTGLIKLQRLL